MAWISFFLTWHDFEAVLIFFGDSYQQLVCDWWIIIFLKRWPYDKHMTETLTHRSLWIKSLYPVLTKKSFVNIFRSCVKGRVLFILVMNVEFLWLYEWTQKNCVKYFYDCMNKRRRNVCSEMQICDFSKHLTL